jgi:hypothetical protein
MVPVICASDNTHLTNVLRDQHAWPLYLTIGNIRKHIRRTSLIVPLDSCQIDPLSREICQ